MYTNNFEWLSQRDTESSGGDVIVVGPGWSGSLPPGAAVVKAPFDDVMLFARVLVRDGDDVPAARDLQRQFTIQPLETSPAQAWPGRSEDLVHDFLALVRHALRRNPPRAFERGMRYKLVCAGLVDAEPALAEWSSALPSFLARLKEYSKFINQPVDHWVYAPKNLGEFGTSYRLRAVIALVGLLALPRSEALYISTEFDADDRPLEGRNAYRLDLPAGGIPADAFWSLTLYEKMPNGARYLFANSLGRHAFNSRTTSLQLRDDGGASIWLSHKPPPDHLASNWLPAPAGTFRLTVRGYHPLPDLLGGRFKLRPVQRVERLDAAAA